MSQLDPDPTNELGRGLLDPGLEAWLLASGYVYARRRPLGHVVASKRPMNEALTDFARSLMNTPPRRVGRQVATSALASGV